MSEEQTIERLKALNVPAFVCQHLIKNPYLNLNFPCCVLDNDAWCDECEKFLQKEHGWTELSILLCRNEEQILLKTQIRIKVAIHQKIRKLYIVRNAI